MENGKNEFSIAFKAETGELYMLGKQDRILLRAILGVALRSSAGRKIIAESHGEDSLQMARSLLDQMGGSFDDT